MYKFSKRKEKDYANPYLKTSHIPWITSILKTILITFQKELQKESANKKGKNKYRERGRNQQTTTKNNPSKFDVLFECEFYT